MPDLHPHYPTTHEMLGQLAMGSYLSDPDDELTFEEYMSDDDARDKVVPWEAVEHMDFSTIQNLVDNDYRELSSTLSTVLKTIKSQIIDDVIEGHFPSDANEIDMYALLEKGLLKAGYYNPDDTESNRD